MREATTVIAVHHETAFSRHHKLEVFAAGDAGGLGIEGGVGAIHPVAITDGHMSAQAVLLAGRRKQVHDILAGIAAMHKVLRTMAQEQLQRVASFRQVVMRVGEQAQFHAVSVPLCRCRGKPQAACGGHFCAWRFWLVRWRVARHSAAPSWWNAVIFLRIWPMPLLSQYYPNSSNWLWLSGVLVL